MAITRSQQAKQMLQDGGMLVSPSKDGKRPGYRGDAAAKSSGAKSQGRVGGSDVGESSTRSDPRDDRPQEYIGGQSYDVIVNDAANKKKREDAREEQRQLREIEKKKFIYEPATYPKFTPGYLKYLANLNREPNRRYFVDKVLKGKNAASLLNKSLGLDADGLSFSPFDLTEEQFEKAYQDYMTDRMSGQTDAMGNINPAFGRDDGPDQPIIFPKDNIGGDEGGGDDAEDDNTQTGIGQGLALRFRKDGGRINAMDGGMMSPEGGIMDLETGRQMYFLGKLVKKATRAVKKVAKSPIGKAALLYGLGAVGGSVGAGKGFFSKGMFNPGNIARGLFGTKGVGMDGGLQGLLGKFKLTEGFGALKPTFAGGLALASLSPLLFQGDEEEEDQTVDRGPGLDIDFIRNNPYNFLGRRFVADGGIMRTGYQEGSKEPVAKKTLPLLDMDGKEMDLREDGGFVPIGRMERADDVPARLSKNEFVFTADAVRNAGNGDVDKGAEVMYNMMKNLESGGEVSEESQGLQGAREMFQTSKRLEEVL